MSVGHSDMSSSYEKLLEKQYLPATVTTGAHKVKYHPQDDWDFHLDADREPIDLSLVLPHYRARNQPIDERMTMFVGSDMGPIKVKICRHVPRLRFYLDVRSTGAPITIWLPSDFRGQINYSGKATFSSGFVNRVMQNVRFNSSHQEDYEDIVVVDSPGAITFRMWDVQTGAPENTHRETLKRMFGCARKAPETSIDWDFLLED
ncbi:hypothetical protein BDN72DRAFT_836523 [Pluteus cervinus]|uniref:Uncharacterized protein n=1 Tax=Pluteus cervinus TaxID=181527 RepID=A0ACD3B1J6_9AGAR|nr:hypothetical protein BDN72DRAFT_836523 [Pluteus cervinus]